MTGFFITFEGGEGSGKTTQARLLAARLEAAGHTVRLTREPGGTPLASALRALLLSPEASLSALAQAGLAPGDEPAEPMAPVTEALILSAARAQHVARMRKWLAADETVISDRYADATLAYQGYGRGFDRAALRELVHLATGGLRPDLTVLLNLPASRGISRIVMRSQMALPFDLPAEQRAQPMPLKRTEAETLNRLDTEALAFHERVREGYLELAEEEPDRWVKINAAAKADVVAESVWRAVSERMVV